MSVTEIYGKIPKVLIVDDIPENIQVLGTILDEDGYEISVAMDGAQALESVNEDRPDIILLDVNMPVMDGHETCIRLKQDPETQEIPVIFLTAKTEEDDIVDGFDIGAVDYVTKPFNSKELKRRIKTHLELYFAKQELQYTISSKNKLFSIIAHDMRTPFNALIGFSNVLLLDQDISEEDKSNFVQIINTASKKGLNLLENLLMWARSQTGRIEFDPESINLFNSLDEQFKLMKYSAKHKSIQLINLVPGDVDVMADEESLKTLFRNLISNAIKFTHKNGSVTVQAHRKDDEWVEIIVSDTGIGMTQELLKNLFVDGEKTSRPGTERESGTGLGLLLVKEFVEKNGGTITAESVVDEGTTFKVCLRSA
jgi:signal transduction histidine kinase